MGCIHCGMSLCELCQECSCCKPGPKSTAGQVDIISGSSDNDRQRVDKDAKNPELLETHLDGGEKANRRVHKSDKDVTDPLSTGRKRAAVLYPIDKTKPCQWQGLTNCGGGKYPVVGCIDGLQKHRHHGPDKNTLNNSAENVHLICNPCHNIWHSQNDPHYNSENPGFHEPRKAEFVELVRRFGGFYKAESEARPGDEIDERDKIPEAKASG